MRTGFEEHTFTHDSTNAHLVALVGDLFRGGIVGSGAETHFYQCDLALNRSNVQRLLKELAPNAQLFFVGHFGLVSREAVVDHFQ